MRARCLREHADPPPEAVDAEADPGDGTCDVAECTLREAITAASATVERDSIHFATPADEVQTSEFTSIAPVVVASKADPAQDEASSVPF